MVCHQVSFDSGPVIMACKDKENLLKQDKGGAIYILPSDNFFTFYRGWDTTIWVNKKDVKPLNKLEFGSAFKTMMNFGVQLFFIDDKTFEEIRESKDNGRQILMKLEKENKSENNKFGINPMPLFDYKEWEKLQK